MRARRNACVINLTSVSGRISSSPLGAYAASKFALEGLSEALAQGGEDIQHPGRYRPARDH
jgi:NAD(P)-dependent dehydrogenase (short-subunit alcohol dehydrogenase family)